AALAVVAETGDDAPEGLRAGVEPRPARVVLEPGERPHDPGLELALEQHVADHARVARDGLQREEADAREVGAAEVAVRAAQQLVAAAHGQHCRAPVDSGANTVGLRDEILGDELLLAVLAATDVQEIVLTRLHRLPDRDRVHLELVPAPGSSLRQHGDVPAVGIDVQVVGIEVTDKDVHAARSQYGRTKPRSATTFRKASIAV